MDLVVNARDAMRDGGSSRSRRGVDARAAQPTPDRLEATRAAT